MNPMVAARHRGSSIVQPMTPEQTLEYEARTRNRHIALAIVAAVCLMAAAIITLVGPHAKVDEATVDLLVANRRFPLDLIAAVINGVGFLATVATLVHLHKAARARNPERVQGYVRIISVTAGVLASVGGIAYAALFAHAVHVFATTGTQTYEEATHLSGGGALLALQLVDLAAALLMALAFVLVSVQAMGQGLLTRPMGYLGMFSGALVLFQITQVPVIQCLWLLAVAYLLSGRWPSGLPPAWRSGRSEPWPSSAEMRTRRAASAGAGVRGTGRRGRGMPAPAGAGAGGGSGSPPAAPAPAAPEARTRAATSKRKRKRRT